MGGKTILFDENGLKPCSKCKENLPKESFYKNSRATKSNYQACCKKCNDKLYRKYIKKDKLNPMFNDKGLKECTKCKKYLSKEKYNKRKKRKSGYELVCRECKSDVNRNYLLKNTFNVTLEEYNRMLKLQNNVCGICEKSETTKNKNNVIYSLSIDHCHTTGQIRGLLCRKCNSGLGMFKDSEILLLKAIKYLKDLN
jgi:hypothetical protein